MVDKATLETRLAEAKQAQHELLTGAKAVSLSYSQGGGSHSMSFTAANLGDLNAYIFDLKRQLGFVSGRRPFRFR